jgi:histidyl-tRNA synthetase
LNKQEAHDVSKLIDRMAKMERGKFIAAVDAACSPKKREGGAVERLLSLLAVKNLKQLPPELKEHPSAAELENMLNMLSNAGIKNARFDVTLMRGFDYYTDIVFEVFDKHPDNNRSMLGGGRYDGLVGLFGVPPVPTVGFGWGDVTLANFLELHHLAPKLSSETDAYVALVGDIAAAAQKPIAKLRSQGVNLAIDLSGRKLGDQLKAADKKGLPFIIIIGEDELKTGKYILKNLAKGTEQKADLKQLTKTLKGLRDK